MEPARSLGCRIFAADPVVLYFYPKDDTPGCTAQACGLRDAWSEFDGRAEIFGVSIDSTASHEKFIAKYDLPFPLLSDREKKIVNAYGVWVEKSMYGRKYMGAERTHFHDRWRRPDRQDPAQGKTDRTRRGTAHRVRRLEMSCQAHHSIYLRCS